MKLRNFGKGENLPYNFLLPSLCYFKYIYKVLSPEESAGFAQADEFCGGRGEQTPE